MRDGFRHYINPDELDVLRRMAGDTGGLCDADGKVFRMLVRRLEDEVTVQSSEEMRSVRLDAILCFETDDVKVDEDAEILATETGYWVQAWLWIPQ
jgi:hypothetical protein